MKIKAKFIIENLIGIVDMQHTERKLNRTILKSNLSNTESHLKLKIKQ